jgi:hypothetical protein
MAVEVANESCVVAGVIVFANPWSALILATCAEGGRMKLVDGFTSRSCERNMKSIARRLRFVAGEDCEGCLALEAFRTITDGARMSPEPYISERG